MTPAGLITYSTALTVAAVIPGPQIVAIVAHAVRSGYGRAASATAGMVLGDLIYLTTALAGLASIAEAFSLALLGIKWAGVGYLCWLAYRFWTSPDSLNVAESGARQSGSAFVSGILITIGNPKSVIFYVSVLPTVIDLREVEISDALLLLLVTAVILSAVQFPFALAGARTRRSLQSPTMMRRFNRVAAVGIAGAAASIAFREQ